MAACAAIWLADSVVLDPEACPPWLMPIWERLDVLVEGRLGSNSPGLAECFLVWLRMRGDEEPWPAGLAGREKLWWRLEVLALLGWAAS